MRDSSEERRRKERIRKEKIRRWLEWGVIFSVTVLASLSAYSTFFVAPDERGEIAETAEETDRVADELQKFQAGATAIFCTGSNRHDFVGKTTIKSLLPGARARDAESGTNLVPGLKKALDAIPPPTNCGDLICQLFVEIGKDEAEIEIRDDFGPDRKRKPCASEEAAEEG